MNLERTITIAMLDRSALFIQKKKIYECATRELSTGENGNCMRILQVGRLLLESAKCHSVFQFHASVESYQNAHFALSPGIERSPGEKIRRKQQNATQTTGNEHKND